MKFYKISFLFVSLYLCSCTNNIAVDIAGYSKFHIVNNDINLIKVTMLSAFDCLIEKEVTPNDSVLMLEGSIFGGWLTPSHSIKSLKILFHDEFGNATGERITTIEDSLWNTSSNSTWEMSYWYLTIE